MPPKPRKKRQTDAAANDGTAATVNLNEVTAKLTEDATPSPSEGVPPAPGEGPVEGTEWSRYFDESGDPYYVHTNGESVWETPPEVAAALADKAPSPAPPATEAEPASDEGQQPPAEAEAGAEPAPAPAEAEAELEPEPEQPRATEAKTQSKSKFTVQTGGGLWGKAGGGFGSTTPVTRGGTAAGNNAGIDDGAFQNLAKANAAATGGELTAEVQDVLNTIAAEDGVANWCGLSSEGTSPALIQSGYGSIDDVRTACFKPDVVCAALLRLQFQTPGATLSKNIYIWWSGDEVGQVRRGKLNTRQETIRELIRPHCTIHCSIEIADTMHASIGAVIEKVVSIISATEEEKANMTVANYTSLLQANVAQRAGGGGGEAASAGEDTFVGTSRFLLVTVKMVLRSTHIQDFGTGTEARQTAQVAWKKCSYEDAHVLVEAKTPLGEEEGEHSDLREHKVYVMLDSTRATARAAASDYLMWVTQKKHMLGSTGDALVAGAGSRSGWSEPGFDDNQGESLIGRRVCVMGRGQGVVRSFEKSRTGPSEHVIEFDVPTISTSTANDHGESKAATSEPAAAGPQGAAEGKAPGESVRVKLQRKGNGETPWIIYT
jgi:hypothetical protein